MKPNIWLPKSWRIYGVLIYKADKEEGRVKLLPSLPRDVVGLDILQDWITELQSAYKQMHEETFPKKEK